MRLPPEAGEAPDYRVPAVARASFIGLPLFSVKETVSNIAFVHPLVTGTPKIARVWRVSSVFSKVNIFRKGNEWEKIDAVPVRNGVARWEKDCDDTVFEEYAATPLPYPDPLGVLTDYFKVKVYVTMIKIRRHPTYTDCWCRFFGRVINEDPVKADKEWHGWWRNPAWVLKIFCEDDVAIDVVPVISGLTINAYYIQSAPHWFWVLDIDVHDPSNVYSKSGIISGNMIRGRYKGEEGACYPDVPDEYFRCAKVRYTVNDVKIEQFKELGHY